MTAIFSVIMPAFNAGKTICRSIESVLNQSVKSFELIIIDDCSTDDTEEKVSKYLNDSRIIYLRNEKNLGVALSRNKGIKHCKGRYIAFLDSDDYWMENKLLQQKKYFDKGYKVVCSNYYADDDSKKKRILRVSPEIIDFRMMLKSNFVGNLTGAYDCSELGKFQQCRLGHEDYIMWLDVLKKGNLAYCIQEPLAVYSISTYSLSSNKVTAMKWQWFIYRNYLKMGFIRSLYYFVNYLALAFKKRI